MSGIKDALRGTDAPARAGVAFAAALILGLIAARAAPAAVVTCGQVITEDTTLSEDLVGCPGDGLVIAAPGITLDLNGHSISGSATSGVGVEVAPRDPDVVVRDGTISGFMVGVAHRDGFTGTAGVTLQRLSLVENRGDGVRFVDFGSITIEDSRILHNGGDGASLIRGRGIRVERSQIAGNGGYGVRDLLAEPALYRDNFVHHNVGHGIFTDDSTSSFLYNTASHNGGSGIYVFDDFTRFFPYLFTANVADDNEDYGIAFAKEGTIGDVDGGGNAAKHNGNPAQCLNIACAFNRGLAKRDEPAPGTAAHDQR